MSQPKCIKVYLIDLEIILNQENCSNFDIKLKNGVAQESLLCVSLVIFLSDILDFNEPNLIYIF